MCFYAHSRSISLSPLHTFCCCFCCCCFVYVYGPGVRKPRLLHECSCAVIIKYYRFCWSFILWLLLLWLSVRIFAISFSLCLPSSLFSLFFTRILSISRAALCNAVIFPLVIIVAAAYWCGIYMPANEWISSWKFQWKLKHYMRSVQIKRGNTSQFWGGCEHSIH